tara:strand:+ start:2953 stop:3951 length:999 start_codon:yes stop_codon:yes gene_type:complete
MSEKVTIAQIGVGYWGPNLLRNLVSNKNCTVKTVLDLSQERLDFVTETYSGIKITKELNDILADDEIDAVVVSTPVNTHFELVMKSLESNKHVLVEKPMAQSTTEVNQIANLADKKNLVAMVGHTFIYNSAVRLVKKILDEGTLGDLQYIYCQRLNLGRIRNDVDALWNLAPHDISIIQYWLDDLSPYSIVRNGMSFLQEGIDDVVFMNIKYPNKVMANIHVSWLDPNKIRKIVLIGSKKMLVYDDLAEDKVIIHDKGIDFEHTFEEKIPSDILQSDKIYRSGKSIVPQYNWEEPLKVEIDHFLDCIINGESCITGPEHAANTVKILSQNEN